MSKRLTPETDAEIDAEMTCACYPKEYVSGYFARKLERERDEAREKYCEVLTDNMLHIATITRLERERDEAIKRSAKLADQLLTEIKNDAK